MIYNVLHTVNPSICLDNIIGGGKDDIEESVPQSFAEKCTNQTGHTSQNTL